MVKPFPNKVFRGSTSLVTERVREGSKGQSGLHLLGGPTYEIPLPMPGQQYILITPFSTFPPPTCNNSNTYSSRLY